MYPGGEATISGFPKSKEFAEALCDICNLEGILEKSRRDLALRSDFNIFDMYRMFILNKVNKIGADCDDVQ